MTAIERAEALLKVAEQEAACRYEEVHVATSCKACRDFEAGPMAARSELFQLGFSRSALRGYIGAVKALGGTAEVVYDLATHRAIADFERLFPETPASAD